MTNNRWLRVTDRPTTNRHRHCVLCNFNIIHSAEQLNWIDGCGGKQAHSHHFCANTWATFQDLSFSTTSDKLVRNPAEIQWTLVMDANSSQSLPVAMHFAKWDYHSKCLLRIFIVIGGRRECVAWRGDWHYRRHMLFIYMRQHDCTSTKCREYIYSSRLSGSRSLPLLSVNHKRTHTHRASTLWAHSAIYYSWIVYIYLLDMRCRNLFHVIKTSKSSTLWNMSVWNTFYSYVALHLLLCPIGPPSYTPSTNQYIRWCKLWCRTKIVEWGNRNFLLFQTTESFSTFSIEWRFVFLLTPFLMIHSLSV